MNNINRCLACTLYEAHMDDMSTEEIVKLNLPRVKDNCSHYLCNNGTCPVYPPTWMTEEEIIKSDYDLSNAEFLNK
jgi:hypothetical protein